MPDIRMRIRGPAGTSTVSLPSTATWGDLHMAITNATSLTSFDLKHGYPPQSLGSPSLDSDVPLSSLEVSLNGAQITVVPHESASSAPTAETSQQPSTAATSSAPDRPLSLARKPNPLTDTSEIPTVPVPDLQGHLTLRVMPDDNSCLFRALSTALLSSSIDGSTELRSIVAQTIQSQPDIYTSAVLERPVDAYCAWIQRPDSWGGGIEMSILSQEFNVEICSVNVQDLRVDRFNEGKERRVVLVYSGIHYDVVAVTPFAGADPELDRKVFDVLRVEGAEIDGGVLEAARVLCSTLRERHYFTDTKGFDIRCNVCGWRGKGESGATQHAKETGHMDFGES